VGWGVCPQVLEALRPLLESETCTLVGYDAKRLAHALTSAYADSGMPLGLHVAEVAPAAISNDSLLSPLAPLCAHCCVCWQVAEDPALQSYVLNPVFPQRDTSALAAAHAHALLRDPTELLGKGVKAVGFERVAVEEAARFAAERAAAMWRVYTALQPRLANLPALRVRPHP
jgi:DNA polymerase I-like protein with 3'-5' exonuclease and polymerase domains